MTGEEEADGGGCTKEKRGFRLYNRRAAFCCEGANLQLLRVEEYIHIYICIAYYNATATVVVRGGGVVAEPKPPTLRLGGNAVVRTTGKGQSE